MSVVNDSVPVETHPWSLMWHQRKELLSQMLSQRPCIKTLCNLNIISPVTVAPALHETLRRLEFLRLLATVDQKLTERPSLSELVEHGIVKPSPAVAPRLHAAQASLEFRKLQDTLHHKLEAASPRPVSCHTTPIEYVVEETHHQSSYTTFWEAKERLEERFGCPCNCENCFYSLPQVSQFYYFCYLYSYGYYSYSPEHTQ